MTVNKFISRLKQLIIFNQKKLILVARIILIGIVVLIEWKLNNRIFALFIVLFSLVAQFFYNKRYFVFIITAILIFFAFNSSTLDYLLLIKRADFPNFQHPKVIINTLFTPNTGREVLPKQVQNMLSLIQEVDIEDYKLSAEISLNGEVVQRIVESAWPVKLEKSSSYNFIIDKEKMEYAGCTNIKQLEDIILVYCP